MNIRTIRIILDEKINAASAAYDRANDALNEEPESVKAEKEASYTYGKYVALIQFRNELDATARMPISR